MDKINRTNFHYQKALELFKKNNVTEAVKELKLCLKFNPKDVLALNLLALGYYLKCRFDKAENYWRQSLAIKRKNNQAIDYLELITKKDFLELRQEYKEILFNDTVGKSEKIEFLKTIINKHDELIEPYLILGLLYKEDQNYQEALKYLYQAYDLDSGNKNIKDYIMECENIENKYKFFSLDRFDLSRFNLEKFKFFKYKKETTLILTALLAVFLIFYINSEEQPVQLDNTVQQEEIKKQSAAAENNKNQNPDQESQQESKNEGFNSLNNLDLKLDLMKFKAIENPISLDLIRTIKENEAKKNSAETYEEYFSEDREQELFNLGLQALRNQRYQDAAAIFEQLYKFSEAEYLKRESLYLLARSSQLTQNYLAAENYYQLYIDNYPETNYYEEALYNLGLLLDEQDKLKEAKEILQQLREDAPYSSYNNSKVYDILNKEN
jgi:tetratricopeptide (TPR) repeat protein